MLAETCPDIVVILTPHPFHAALAIDALAAGAHVLTEKPMAVEVAEADAMIEAATGAGRLLAVNFQQRFRPEVQSARQLIESGALGRVQSVEMTVAWPRTAAYYRLGSWRGTWAGEGGGILMNQAPHDLDLIGYLLGSPARVFGWTRTTLHAIETEDTAHAILEWESGALGTIHVSTAEAGRPEQLLIVGTAGSVEIARGALRRWRLESDMREFIATNPEPFAAPAVHEEPVPLPSGAGDHAAVYRNLHAAILRGEPLVCDGIAGRMSLELANAITLSSLTHQEVSLPLDRAADAALLADLKAHRMVVPGSSLDKARRR
jgi:predicted dehydrogenase